jgi:hypothetical protein
MGAATPAAAAEKKKVVVEQFNGPSADRFRQMVQSAVGKINDVEVIPDKRVASVEADLGLISVADSYPAVAKQLGNAAFIGGSISQAKRPKAKLVVKGPDGSPLGDESWTADNTNKLLSAIGANLGTQLDAILNKTKGAGGGGGGAPEIRESRKPEPLAAALPAEKPAPKKKTKAEEDEWQAGGARKKDDTAVASASEPDRAEARAEASVEAEPAAEDAPSGPSEKRLALVLGVRFMGRHLVYNDNIWGGQQDYKLPKTLMPYVPTPNLTVEFFPIKWVGLSVAGEYSIGLISKDGEGNLYKTVAYALMLGARGDIALGPAALEPFVGYGQRVFKIAPLEDDPMPPQVAGVDYRHAKLGSAATVKVSSSLALTAGAYYLLILSSGQITKAPAKDEKFDKAEHYFYAKSTTGGEAFAGAILALPFLKNLDARLTIDFRRIVFAFDVEKGDPRVAGGATDQYLGLNLAVGYNLGL